MKKLSCQDVSGWECPFVAQGQTDEEVKAQIMEHSTSAHSERMSMMSDEEEVDMDLKMSSLLANQL